MDKESSEYPPWTSLILHELQTELSTIDVNTVVILDCLNRIDSRNLDSRNLKKAEQSAHAIRLKIREMSSLIRAVFHHVTESSGSDGDDGGAEGGAAGRAGGGAEGGAAGRAGGGTEGGAAGRAGGGTEGGGEKRSVKIDPSVFFHEVLQPWVQNPQTDISIEVYSRAGSETEGFSDERRVAQPPQPYRSGSDHAFTSEAEIQIPLSARSLTLILNVLMSNAVRYRDGDLAVIQFTVIIKPKTLMILCRDFGKGIRSADLPEIGSPHFRGANATHISGSGLGLYFVSSLIEQCQGLLTVQSEEGTFTEVQLEIPLEQPVHRH